MNSPAHEDGGEERFAREAGGLLRQGAERLDAATLSRLNRARQAALAEFDAGARTPQWWRGWQPVAVTAVVGALAVGLWLGAQRGTAPGEAPAAAAARVAPERAGDLEVLLADDNLDLIDEFEFYDWLDTDAAASEAADPGRTG